MLFSPSTPGFFKRDIHTVVPDDVVEITEPQYAALLAGQAAGGIIVADASGYPTLVDPPPAAPDLTAQVAAAVQAHLDAVARRLGYDNMASAVTYADEPAVAAWQAEGRALRRWRSLVWAQCHQWLAEVQSGGRAIMSPDQVVADLLPFTLFSPSESE